MKIILFNRCYWSSAPLPLAHLGYLHTATDGDISRALAHSTHSACSCIFSSLPKGFNQHSLNGLTSCKHKCLLQPRGCGSQWGSQPPPLQWEDFKVPTTRISVGCQQDWAWFAHSYNLILSRCHLVRFSFFPPLLSLLPHLHFLGSPFR